MKRFLLASLTLCLLVSSINAGEEGWRQWRGPQGRGISQETGLLQFWPAEGPQKRWTSVPIGKGYASPIVAQKAIFVAGDVGKELVIFALNLDGTLKWKQTNGAAWTQAYPGSRSSGSYSDGKLYNINAFGQLLCLDAETGQPKWSINVIKKFKSRGEKWGVIDSMVIDEAALYVSVNGAKSMVAALDKDTGAVIWNTPNSTQDNYTYSSPILATINGRRQVVSCGSSHTYGVDIKTGALLWRFPHVYKGRMIATMPTFAEGALFVTNAQSHDAITYRLDFDKGTVKKSWQAFLGTSIAGGIVITKGLVYGSRHSKKRGFVCLDAKTGEQKWIKPDTRGASVIYANNRVYCQEATGTLYLLADEGAGFGIKGKLALIKKPDFWAHPVIAEGRLYLRYGETLHCYDIKR